MKKTLTILVLAFLLSLINSCVSIKSDYPDIKFYALDFNNDNISAGKKIEGSLLVRGFEISNEYNTDYLLVNTEGSIKRYFYHRWIKNFELLATDYIVKAMTEKEIFSKGIFTISTYIAPDYVLEGYVMDVKTVFDDENEDYFVELKIKFNMIERIQITKEPVELFNKVFSSKVKIEDDKIMLVPPAVETAMEDITSRLISEIAEHTK